MGNYKKKKVSAQKRNQRNSQDIRMKTRASHESTQTKHRQKRSKIGAGVWLVIAVLLAVLLIAYAVFISIHPVGAVEYFKTQHALSGSGDSFNNNISGGKPLFTLSADKCFFLITDSNINCYNLNGKMVFSQLHNYSRPVSCISETRIILFDQGETDLTVYGFGNKLFARHFEKGIITAAISKCGVYAVATKAEGYDSVVSVFDKNNNQIYQWFSSSETVNALALSDDGKTLGVATLSVKEGRYSSSVYALNFDSANPIMKTNYTDKTVYQLFTSSSSVFCAVFNDKIDFINYKKGNTVSHESEHNINIVKKTEGKIIALKTVSGNQDENLIDVYKKNGELQATVKISKHITDFSFKSGKINLLCLDQIEKYDMDGKLIGQAQTGYDACFIETQSDRSVICVRNSVIETVLLNKPEV